jgi:hypothetical protein
MKKMSLFFFDIGITCQKIDRLTEQKSELFGGGREGGKTCQLKKTFAHVRINCSLLRRHTLRA